MISYLKQKCSALCGGCKTACSYVCDKLVAVGKSSVGFAVRNFTKMNVSLIFLYQCLTRYSFFYNINSIRIGIYALPTITSILEGLRKHGFINKITRRHRDKTEKFVESYMIAYTNFAPLFFLIVDEQPSLIFEVIFSNLLSLSYALLNSKGDPARISKIVKYLDDHHLEWLTRATRDIHPIGLFLWIILAMKWIDTEQRIRFLYVGAGIMGMFRLAINALRYCFSDFSITQKNITDSVNIFMTWMESFVSITFAWVFFVELQTPPTEWFVFAGIAAIAPTISQHARQEELNEEEKTLSNQMEVHDIVAASADAVIPFLDEEAGNQQSHSESTAMMMSQFGVDGAAHDGENPEDTLASFLLDDHAGTEYVNASLLTDSNREADYHNERTLSH